MRLKKGVSQPDAAAAMAVGDDSEGGSSGDSGPSVLTTRIYPQIQLFMMIAMPWVQRCVVPMPTSFAGSFALSGALSEMVFFFDDNLLVRRHS